MDSLLHHNTFGIEQYCKSLREPDTEEELIRLLQELRGEPLLVIGGGSNLLLTKDYEGNVIHPTMKGISAFVDDDKILLRCCAGEVWDEVVAYAVGQGYNNMENLSYIPGEVGASAVQNIGAYGMEARDIIYMIEAIEVASGGKVYINPADCKYGYRTSIFKTDWRGQYVVTAVTYVLSHTFTPRLDYGNLRSVVSQQLQDEHRDISDVTAADVRKAVIAIRKAKLPDPAVEGNAGSFFVNPVVPREKFEALLTEYPDMPHYHIDDRYEKIPAGWMIEQCGWKGRTLGNAGVSEKQALILVNKGGATGAEVLRLCDTVRRDVFNKFGVMIYPEVNII